MVFLVIFALIVGLIVSAIIFGVAHSAIGFIVCGVLLVLFILIKLFAYLYEEHPIVLVGIYLVASIVCGAITVSQKSIAPLAVCLLSIGALKWGFITADIDTSWYDTDYISVDGVLYQVFDSEREGYILFLGLIVFMGLYFLLGVPYLIFKSAWLAFIPAIFFAIALVKRIVLANR